MRTKRTKGQTTGTPSGEPIAGPSNQGSGPIALRTRAGTKSPHKRPTTTSLKQAQVIASKRKGKQPVREPPLGNLPASSMALFEGSNINQSGNSSPGDYPQRVGRVRIIPDGLVSYSQRRDEYDVDVNTSGVVIDGPGGPEMLDNSSPGPHGGDHDEIEEGDELQEDEDDGVQQDSLGFQWPGYDGDPELFQGNTNGDITDVTPVARAARILSMAGIHVESPLIGIPGRNTERERQLDASPEGRASAIVESAFDVLEQHRARRQRPAPRPDVLGQAAGRIDPSRSQGPSTRAGPSMSRIITERTSQPNSRNIDNRSRDDAQRTSGIVPPWMPNGSNPGVRLPDAIAALARQPVQGGQPEEERDDNDPGGDEVLRRRRSGNPAPHQMFWHTPHSREFHCWAKVDYSFKIATENAYPTAQERLLMARAAYDSAAAALPELAENASGVAWSIEKMRLYTDTAWVRRGIVKACASSLVYSTYRLALTPAIATQMPGGATQGNQAAFTSERVSYLFTDGHWLRGRLNGIHVKTSSMLYAHPIFGDIIEETIYRPATAPQRAKLCPMPIPALALVATAVQCALEEYASGYRKRIPFTEESYRRVYSLHVKRLNRAMTTHRHHMTELLQTFYEHCVTRNEPLPNQNPREEEEFDDLDVLLSDYGGNEELEGFEVIEP